MKNGYYKCSHCGHITYRTVSGKNRNGTVLWLRCEKCQFDTLYHESWWLQGLGIVTGEEEKHLLEIAKEFAEAKSKDGKGGDKR